MKYIKEKGYNNTKLINSIKDDAYRKEVLGNGYCVGLLENGEISEKDGLGGQSTIHLSFKIRGSLLLSIYKMENRFIDHMIALIFIDMSISEVSLVTINAVDKKNKVQPIGVSFPYSDVTIVLGDVLWHKIDTSDWEDYKYVKEFWIRIDMVDKRGELYFGIDETLKNIIYLMS